MRSKCAGLNSSGGMAAAMDQCGQPSPPLQRQALWWVFQGVYGIAPVLNWARHQRGVDWEISKRMAGGRRRRLPPAVGMLRVQFRKLARLLLHSRNPDRRASVIPWPTGGLQHSCRPLSLPAATGAPPPRSGLLSGAQQHQKPWHQPASTCGAAAEPCGRPGPRRRRSCWLLPAPRLRRPPLAPAPSAARLP